MGLALLVLGLIVFLGTHSIRIVADDWRTAQRARLGEMRWKGIFSLASAIGLALTVWGYGEAWATSPLFWKAPLWIRNLVALAMLPAFVLLVAAYVQGTRIKAMVGHPMLAGVALWSGSHLVTNGRLGSIILFGGFLAWAVADFLSNRRRDRAEGRRHSIADGWLRDFLAVAIGALAWGLVAVYGHESLLGVRLIG